MTCSNWKKKNIRLKSVYSIINFYILKHIFIYYAIMQYFYTWETNDRW